MKSKTRLAAWRKRRAGESLGEVLISVLISAVALVMLVSMITTSTSLISRSRDKLEDYYNAQSDMALAGGTDDPQNPNDVAGTATLTCNDDSAVTAVIDAVYSVEDDANGTKLVSYRKAVPAP